MNQSVEHSTSTWFCSEKLQNMEKKTIVARNLKSFIVAVGWVATHRRQERVREGILEHIKIQEAGYLMSYAKFQDAFLKKNPEMRGTSI